MLTLLQQQPPASDEQLIDAAISDAEIQYGTMLLQQQDARCAAHTAQLHAEGWFDQPPQLTSTQAVEGLVPTPVEPVPVSEIEHHDGVAVVVPHEMLKIQQLTGRVFTLDATFFPDGINSPIATQCCSVQEPFTVKAVAGHHSWVCHPYDDIADYVDHYLQQKTIDPEHTSACFVVPKRRTLPHPALTGMRVVAEYCKGHHLFSKGGKRCRGLSDPLLVYYDPPAPTLPVHSDDLHPSKLLMQYKCHVHGAKATVLLDQKGIASTGAEGYCYVSTTFLQRNSIHYTTTETVSEPGVVYADGTVKQVAGHATLSVHIQKYAAKLRCSVVDLDEQFDLILGQQWLHDHDAVLYMTPGVATIKQKGQLITLRNLGPCTLPTPVEESVQHADDAEMSSHATDTSQLPRIATITHKQAKRIVRKGGQSLLVLVRESPPSEPTPVTPVVPPQLQQLQQEFNVRTPRFTTIQARCRSGSHSFAG